MEREFQVLFLGAGTPQQHMARLFAEFYFQIDKLVAKPEILGRTLTFRRGIFDCEIRSPANKDELPVDGLFARLLVDIGLSMGTLPVIRFRLRFDSDISSAAFTTEEANARQKALEALDSAFREASAIFSELLQWARIRGQVWLDAHPDSLALLRAATLTDEEANMPLPVELSRPYRLPTIPTTAAIDLTFFENLPGLLGASRPPLPLAEAVYADARQFADETPPDLDKAVLMAAIACEAKVKQTLRGLSGPELAPVVDLILSNPRDWSLAASRLFDEVMKAVLKRSLRYENLALFKRVDKLFAYRNTIAHSKIKRPTDDELRDAVDAAKLALEWLGTVQSSAGNAGP